MAKLAMCDEKEGRGPFAVRPGIPTANPVSRLARCPASPVSG
jgi:hypothetical protein